MICIPLISGLLSTPVKTFKTLLTRASCSLPIVSPRDYYLDVIAQKLGVPDAAKVLLSSIMNLFGVLKYKKMGEDFVQNSGLTFTIMRSGRLTDGPYTSYDLNTLLIASSGGRRAVIVGQGDKLAGERDGPESDQQKWRELFKNASA